MAETVRARDPRKDAWDYFWKDKHGKVVIYQWPNVYILAWLLLTIISLFTEGTLSSVLGYVATAALVAWALLEMFAGVNYFRRSLGVIVLGWSILSLVTTIF